VTEVQPIALVPREDGRDPMFVAVLDYVLAQNKKVEPLYQMEQAAKLGHGEQPVTDEARAFFAGQFLTGGQMLAAIWLTAQRSVVPDVYLRASLVKRQVPPGTKPAPVKRAPSKKKTENAN
jgi:hypothetical protein